VLVLNSPLQQINTFLLLGFPENEWLISFTGWLPGIGGPEHGIESDLRFNHTHLQVDLLQLYISFQKCM
jgi:hypothetical protein